jgi:hypothetical protein
VTTLYIAFDMANDDDGDDCGSSDKYERTTVFAIYIYK